MDGLARAQLLWGPAHAAEHIPPPPPGTRIVLAPLIDAASRPKLALEQPAKVRELHWCTLLRNAAL